MLPVKDALASSPVPDAAGFVVVDAVGSGDGSWLQTTRTSDEPRKYEISSMEYYLIL